MDDLHNGAQFYINIRGVQERWPEGHLPALSGTVWNFIKEWDGGLDTRLRMGRMC